MNKFLIVIAVTLIFVLAQDASNNGKTEKQKEQANKLKELLESYKKMKDECNINNCICHPSCICDQGSSICKKCRLDQIGSEIDASGKSCPCPVGYYTSSLRPFTCTKNVEINALQSIDNEGACNKECEIKSRDITLNTNCYYCQIDGKSYVTSEVSLNFNSISINSVCKKNYKHTIQYLSPSINGFLQLDEKYITYGENGSLKIDIPLIDVYDLSPSPTIGDSQISQTINFLSIIGTKDKYLKMIKWAICIYTNRDQVQLFQLDTDILETEQECEDCIVIADLDTVASIYEDETFLTEKNAPYNYIVGDYFYAKITFVDPSYTKYLKFESLYYKNDLGQIFDYSSITTHAWKDNGLTIAFPLTEPSNPAVIQVRMTIDPVSGGRFLQNQDLKGPKQNFKFAVISDKLNNNDSNDINNNDNNNHDLENSSSLIIFGFINLITIILII